MADAFDGCDKISLSQPQYINEAEKIAADLGNYSAQELQYILNINGNLARQNKLRYLDFNVKSKEEPAIYAYTGTAYKSLDAQSFTAENLEYANRHLLIGSFMYGLLRPLDAIHPYRLEGKVTLPALGTDNIFDFWKPRLTDWFIEQVKEDDGILINLASNEYRHILDWKKVTGELKVITPQFKVRNGMKLSTVVVYAKMCRGAMTRWIMTNTIDYPAALEGFEYQGFKWNNDYNFILDQ